MQNQVPPSITVAVAPESETVDPITERDQVIALLILGYQLKESRKKVDTLKVVEFIFLNTVIEGRSTNEACLLWKSGIPLMGNLQLLRIANQTFNYHAMELHREKPKHG